MDINIVPPEPIQTVTSTAPSKIIVDISVLDPCIVQDSGNKSYVRWKVITSIRSQDTIQNVTKYKRFTDFLNFNKLLKKNNIFIDHNNTKLYKLPWYLSILNYKKFNFDKDWLHERQLSLDKFMHEILQLATSDGSDSMDLLQEFVL